MLNSSNQVGKEKKTHTHTQEHFGQKCIKLITFITLTITIYSQKTGYGPLMP